MAFQMSSSSFCQVFCQEFWSCTFSRHRYLSASVRHSVRCFRFSLSFSTKTTCFFGLGLSSSQSFHSSSRQWKLDAHCAPNLRNVWILFLPTKETQNPCSTSTRRAWRIFLGLSPKVLSSVLVPRLLFVLALRFREDLVRVFFVVRGKFFGDQLVFCYWWYNLLLPYDLSVQLLTYNSAIKRLLPPSGTPRSVRDSRFLQGSRSEWRPRKCPSACSRRAVSRLLCTDRSPEHQDVAVFFAVLQRRCCARHEVPARVRGPELSDSYVQDANTTELQREARVVSQLGSIIEDNPLRAGSTETFVRT